MTATPIPRTLAMTVYGDLDLSVIDELPPGRKEIKTVHVRDSQRPALIEFMKKQIAEGRQIYVVFPLIEESAKLDLENLQDGFDRMSNYFPKPDYQLSIVHGRMKPDVKEFEMKRFVDGNTDIMVATTVIEVGVDVPNASMMIIENSERFGLSQLHQLRGRVGRGASQSYCVLISGNKLTVDARERIRIMESTNDGFKIAEADLKLRGPGVIDGTKQSGSLDLKIANIASDGHILMAARKAAQHILSSDPQLESEDVSPLRQFMETENRLKTHWGRIS